MYDRFDVVIIGGGTVGLAVALDASLRGLRIAVVEKGEIGKQTNYASLGMLQPGLNYLHKDRDLVYMNAIDCRLFADMVPHLLSRKKFMIPVFPDSKYPLWVWDSYMTAYDRLSRISYAKPHARLNTDGVILAEPELRGEIIGGVMFEELVVDTLELAHTFADAIRQCGGVIFEDAQVYSAVYSTKDFSHFDAIGIRQSDGLKRYIQSKYFVNAAGPWASSLLSNVFNISGFPTRPTKGTSIIVGKHITQNAVIVFTGGHKYIAIIPLPNNRTLIGPTNEDIPADIISNPDFLASGENEINFLLGVARKHFAVSLERDDILEIRCGLRPQLNHKKVSPNNILHEFTLIDHAKRDGIANLCTIFGGKLSTQLRMAKETVDFVCGRLGIDAKWQLPRVRLTPSGIILNTCETNCSANWYEAVYCAPRAIGNIEKVGHIARRHKVESLMRLMPYIAGGLTRELLRRMRSGGVLHE